MKSEATYQAERDARVRAETQAAVLEERCERLNERVSELKHELTAQAYLHSVELTKLRAEQEKQIADVIERTKPKEPFNFDADGPALNMTAAAIRLEPAYTKRDMMLRDRRYREALEREAEERGEQRQARQESMLTDEEKRELTTDEVEFADQVASHLVGVSE